MSIKLLRISTETYSLNILLKGQLNYMTRQGIEVFMASSPDENVSYLEEQQNAKFFPLPLSRELTPIKDLIALYHTIRLIIKLKPQIVHTHSPKAGIVGMLAAFLCGVPVKVHTVAGLPLMEAAGAKRKLLNLVESLTYWCADWVLPNSNELKNFIIDEKLTSNVSKVKVIGNGSSNGIDLKYFSVSPEMKLAAKEFKKKHAISTESVILTFMGRLANYKGVNELVEAFLQLQKKHDNLILLLVGGIEELNPLKDSTKFQLTNNKSIIAVGHQKDVRMYLAVSDIFVFPSYREGFPQALMQASAMSLPSVATNINGCNEIIQDGISGILIQPKNIEDITSACSKLIEDKNVRKSMGQSAYKHVAHNFEQSNLWKNIFQFYKSSLTQK